MKTKTVLNCILVCIGIFTLQCILARTVSAVSINITIDTPAISLDLASLSVSGSFGESAQSTISVTTDNQSGYSLNVSSPNGSSLIHTEYSDKTITSINSATSESVFSARANTSYNNKWGYRPSKINGIANNNFLPAPSVEGDIIDTVWTPNSAANEYTISVGARVNSETVSGTYHNTLVISAVPNAPILAVIYDGNGLYYDNNPANTSNMVIYDAEMSIVDEVATYTKTVLEGSFKTPSNPNIFYKFRGWSEDPDAIYATYADEASVISDLQKVNGDPAVTLYAVWSRVYTLQYDGNGADNIDGMGSTNVGTGLKTVHHSNVAVGDTFDLFASNFKRDGYGFVGWSFDADAWEHLTDNNPSNDPEIYGPNEMITAPAYRADIIALKAVWAPAETSGDDRVMLQDWSGCSNLTPTLYDSNSGRLTIASNSITALTDNRDNQVYAVARLADENCWLIENLRLNNIAELSVDNTNIDASVSSLPITNVYNSDPALATTSNHLSQSSNGNAFNDYSYGWCSQNTESCLNQSRFNSKNTSVLETPSKAQVVNVSGQHDDFGAAYSYGNYYNWYSATAGYGVYSATTSLPTNGDICPAGWHLPYGSNGVSEHDIGGASGGFAYLDSRMGGSGVAGSNILSSNRWRRFPNNYVYSGYINNGANNSPGGYGSYWSASANDNNYSYYLKMTNAYIGPGVDTFSKYLGLAVRCIINN